MLFTLQVRLDLIFETLWYDKVISRKDVKYYRRKRVN